MQNPAQAVNKTRQLIQAKKVISINDYLDKLRIPMGSHALKALKTNTPKTNTPDTNKLIITLNSNKFKKLINQKLAHHLLIKGNFIWASQLSVDYLFRLFKVLFECESSSPDLLKRIFPLQFQPYDCYLLKILKQKTQSTLKDKFSLEIFLKNIYQSFVILIITDIINIKVDSNPPIYSNFESLLNSKIQLLPSKQKIQKIEKFIKLTLFDKPYNISPSTEEKYLFNLNLLSLIKKPKTLEKALSYIQNYKLEDSSYIAKSFYINLLKLFDLLPEKQIDSISSKLTEWIKTCPLESEKNISLLSDTFHILNEILKFFPKDDENFSDELFFDLSQNILKLYREHKLNILNWINRLDGINFFANLAKNNILNKKSIDFILNPYFLTRPNKTATIAIFSNMLAILAEINITDEKKKEEKWSFLKLIFEDSTKNYLIAELNNTFQNKLTLIKINLIKKNHSQQPAFFKNSPSYKSLPDEIFQSNKEFKKIQFAKKFIEESKDSLPKMNI